jgi:hypothetical protein
LAIRRKNVNTNDAGLAQDLLRIPTATSDEQPCCR